MNLFLFATNTGLLARVIVLAVKLADRTEERDEAREERNEAREERDEALAQVHDLEQFLAILHDSYGGQR